MIRKSENLRNEAVNYLSEVRSCILAIIPLRRDPDEGIDQAVGLKLLDIDAKIEALETEIKNLFLISFDGKATPEHMGDSESSKRQATSFYIDGTILVKKGANWEHRIPKSTFDTIISRLKQEVGENGRASVLKDGLKSFVPDHPETHIYDVFTCLDKLGLISNPRGRNSFIIVGTANELDNAWSTIGRTA